MLKLSIVFVLLMTACSSAKKGHDEPGASSTAAASPVGTPSAPRPKYAAPQTPAKGSAALRLAEHHDFIQKNSAPDFWALIPYYVPQEKGTCAASALAMVVNGLNVHKSLNSDDKLVTTKDLVAKVNDKAWVKSMQDEKCYDLDRLAEIVKKVLRIYGHEKSGVKVVHIDADTKAARAQVRRDLLENEKSDRTLILANFLQGQFTGDPEGTGHVSPVGAYDVARKRVLVLDVEREYYEPYWVTEDIFFAGLHTKDSEGAKYRGYILIQE